MSITINGSGTVTGISVGGIPDGVVDTDVLAANAVTFGKIGTTEQGQLCKAWVNFNGTGAVAIRASYNVSSITDNGTGNYTVNFTTAMVDVNYAVQCQASFATTGTGSGRNCLPNQRDKATSSYRQINTDPTNGALTDAPAIDVAIFR